MIINKIDKILDLPTKSIIKETSFTPGQKLQHKSLGAKGFFVRDLGNNMIEIEREKDKKKFKVKASDWEPIERKVKLKIGGKYK